MIVSFSRNFAFVAVPRTGTHSIRSALRPYLAANDWEQCTRFERRLCPVPQIAAFGHGHLTACQLAEFMIPGLWRSMFGFAFLRDPLERFQSAYYQLHGLRGLAPGKILQDMKAALNDPERRSHVLFRPQSEFICDDNGEVAVSFLGRFSHLQQDLNSVLAQIGLPPTVPPRVNAATYATGLEPDQELRERVAEFYGQDYDLLLARAGTAA